MTTDSRTSPRVLALLGAFAAGGAVGGAVGWVARGSTESSGWVTPDQPDVPPVTDADVHGHQAQLPNVDDEILPKAGFDPDRKGSHGTSVADQPWAGHDPMHRAF